MTPRVVILVPRREGIADRDRLWDFTRPWWREHFPDWPIVEGHHDRGLFNRSAAVNAAAREAGDWDVAVLIDSDILLDAEAVRAAVPMAVETGQMVVPFEVRHNLSAHGTRRILDGDTGSWLRFRARSYQNQHSACVVIPRTLYDDIGGFDEGFRGWGFEDSAFALACELFAGRPLVRLGGGDLWHLHHATNKGEKHGTPSHTRNMARKRRYDEAVAAGWWARFAELHPGWRLMTHRDPLDAAEWPLTSPHWHKAANGAQLADLVRLEALLRWGGVYVDQDVEPFRPLDPLLGAEVVAAWEDDKVIPNAVLGARPDHPLIRRCLELAIARMRVSTWDAGPGVTTRVLRDAPGVLLLPPGAFYPVHYKDPERDTLMAQKPPPWAFVRHAYWGSWLEESRRRVPAA